MEIIKCGKEHFKETEELYKRVLESLEANVNYPKWTKDYPNGESIGRAVERGEQYVCVDGGRIIGAFVLNGDPAGDYGAGEWRRELSEGEYLVIHTLAVDPSLMGRGIGRYMVDFCVSTAKNAGYKAVRLDVVPENFPAAELYKRKGFLFAGKKDLKRGIEGIPEFELYELNF